MLELKSFKDKILPFFENHALKTSKNVDFLKFRQVIKIMAEKRHFTVEGLNEIKIILSRMNHRGKTNNNML